MKQLRKMKRILFFFAEMLIQFVQFSFWTAILAATLYVLVFTGSDLSQFRYTGF